MTKGFEGSKKYGLPEVMSIDDTLDVIMQKKYLFADMVMESLS